ncbi:hypothetical protein [Candidatus Nanohalococcus occultus]|uniref:hypothetical protein n=1 Tax=Candidatus Nanohalococcus occultus TaxID=2978047 RepID=UPI0039E03FAD
MNTLRRIIYILVAGAAFTALAVELFPGADFVSKVPTVIGLGIGTLAILTGISVYLEGSLDSAEKAVLMNGFLLAVMVPTVYASGSFMHETMTSWTNGEVHYHADYEVLVEENGELVRTNLVNPEEFCKDTSHESSYMCKINDRTGSTKYHEHNDQRIHLEGTFKTRESASLAAFFETFGGKITNEELIYPTTEGLVNITEDGGKQIKILVKKGVGGSREWCVVGNNAAKERTCKSYGELATSPENYVVSPYTQNPSNSEILDKIFIVYDSKTAQQAWEDIREDDKYEGFGLKKSGEGYDG